MPVITPTHEALDAEDIDQFESRFGIQFPPDYRRFLLEYNGGTTLPNRFETEDGKIESMVVRFFSMYDPEDDALEDEYTDLSLDDELPSNLLPIAIDPVEDRIVISLSGDDRGAVYYWNWGAEPDPASCSYRYMRRIAPNFDAFLAKLR